MDLREALMPSFGDIRNTKVPRGTCGRCGEGTTAGSVIVAVRSLNKDTKQAAGSVASQSRSLCEPCSVAVYETLCEAFDQALESS